MKIFILDDEIDTSRADIKTILRHHKLTIARDVPEAKKVYEGGYDLLLLDHDMMGYYEEPLARHKNTGTWFVKWLVDQAFKLPTQVILHSQNSIGRDEMEKLFKDVGFTNVDQCPFSSRYLKLLREQLGRD